MPYPAKLSAPAIVQAARELLHTTPPEALTMRELAAHLGVRPSSLYRHVPDQGALFSTLEQEIVTELGRAVVAASADPEASPQGRLLDAAHAYVAYAEAHPHAYALMLTSRPPAKALPGPGKDLWNHFLLLIEGVSGQSDHTDAAVALWALLHGYVVLGRSGQFGISGPKQGLITGLNALMAGLAQPAPAQV